MSSSALRFSPALQELINAEFKDHPPECIVSEGGGWGYNEYAIHQLEIIVTAMGTGIKRARQIGTINVNIVQLEYADGRKVFMNLSRTHRFSMSIKGLETTHHLDAMGAFFPGLIEAIFTFFTSRQSLIAPEETIEIIKVLDASIQCLNQADRWVDVDSE